MVKITESDSILTVRSPYNAAFVEGARKLSGRFDRAACAWNFPASQRERVAALLREVYGTDGSAPIPTVTLRVRLMDSLRYTYDASLELGGRRVARVFGRDGGARLSDGVVVVEGSIGSGGSRKNPRLTVADGTEIELLDVPRPIAERLAASTEGPVVSAAIVESEEIDREALAEERARLVARIAEIDALLAE